MVIRPTPRCWRSRRRCAPQSVGEVVAQGRAGKGCAALTDGDISQALADLGAYRANKQCVAGPVGYVGEEVTKTMFAVFI